VPRLVLLTTPMHGTRRPAAAQRDSRRGEIVHARSYDEVRERLARAHVAVLPAPRVSGFPMKLLNYMAAGKAIVASVSSAKGLRDGVTGRVVADGDPGGFAAAVVDLLARRRAATPASAWRRALPSTRTAPGTTCSTASTRSIDRSDRERARTCSPFRSRREPRHEPPSSYRDHHGRRRRHRPGDHHQVPRRFRAPPSGAFRSSSATRASWRKPWTPPASACRCGASAGPGEAEGRSGTVEVIDYACIDMAAHAWGRL